MFFRLKTCTSRLLLLGLFCVVALFLIINQFPDTLGRKSSKLVGTAASLKDERLVNVVISDGSEIPFKIIRVGMDRDAENSTKSKKAGKRKITNDTGGCKIPHLDKDRPEVIKFMKKYAPLKCAQKNGLDWLEIDEERRIQLTAYAKKILNPSKLYCTWHFFNRLSDTKLNWFTKKKFKIGDTIQSSDFFKIYCEEGKLKWDGVFMTVVPKSNRIKELKQIKQPYSWSGLNVYILGFDSLSQMAFRRSLPKTTEYLEKVMKSVVFNGYNIVGDGTPQAYIPFLTGQTEEELPLTRKRFPNAHFVDDVYPFAWANFSKAGYATLYGEDSHAIGTFTYRLKGFRKQPTDHFTPPFFQYFEKNCGSWVCPCVGSVPQHQLWFKYAEQFWKEYAEVPRFLLLHHSALSHDDINKVQLADIDLRDHLKRQFETGAFNNTLVVVMADHGHRFAELRETHQGQLEERLPFFSAFLQPSFAVDPRFKSAYKNLIENAKDRLVTHFDMHSTLMDLLNWPTPSLQATTNEVTKSRSLSIFRSIPLNRTCNDAGIEPHWCTCLNWQSAMTTERINSSGRGDFYTSNRLAKAVVQVINEQTQPERKLCARLALDRLVDAKKLVPNDKLLKYTGISDYDGFAPKLEGHVQANKATYQLVFTTKPGAGKYEATVLYDVCNPSIPTVTVDLAAISHINAYGTAPHCIVDKNFFLATYCVCYDKI